MVYTYKLPNIAHVEQKKLSEYQNRMIYLHLTSLNLRYKNKNKRKNEST